MIALIVLKALLGCVFAVVCMVVAIIIAAKLIEIARTLAHDAAEWFRKRWSKRFHAWLGRLGI